MFFVDDVPTKSELAAVKIPGSEELRAGAHEVWVHYPDGMGQSKLVLPWKKTGTGRNLNTVQRLAELCDALAAQ